MTAAPAAWGSLLVERKAQDVAAFTGKVKAIGQIEVQQQR
jgi:hypothetical protein